MSYSIKIISPWPMFMNWPVGIFKFLHKSKQKLFVTMKGRSEHWELSICHIMVPQLLFFWKLFKQGSFNISLLTFGGWYEHAASWYKQIHSRNEMSLKTYDCTVH
jgi:hypothetical protein